MAAPSPAILAVQQHLTTHLGVPTEVLELSQGPEAPLSVAHFAAILSRNTDLKMPTLVFRHAEVVAFFFDVLIDRVALARFEIDVHSSVIDRKSISDHLDGIGGDALLLESSFDSGRFTFNDAFEDAVEIDPEDHVKPALQVQAEIDFFFDREFRFLKIQIRKRWVNIRSG